jgi:hypothetical protein
MQVRTANGGARVSDQDSARFGFWNLKVDDFHRAVSTRENCGKSFHIGILLLFI